MDYDKLIERLNTKLQSYASYTDSEFAHAMEDAITAIETLRAESIMHHNAADNYFAEANEYREERNDALTELEQMAACIYYKPGGLCRYGGDDPANMCVLGPCPNNKSAEKVLADLARVTAERDAAIERVKRALAMMWFAYVNSDKEFPHSYETEALEEAERILGPWAECMPKYLRRGIKED